MKYLFDDLNNEKNLPELKENRKKTSKFNQFIKLIIILSICILVFYVMNACQSHFND